MANKLLERLLGFRTAISNLTSKLIEHNNNKYKNQDILTLKVPNFLKKCYFLLLTWFIGCHDPQLASTFANYDTLTEDWYQNAAKCMFYFGACTYAKLWTFFYSC